MQYMGGKTRIAKDLARTMLALSAYRDCYVEPFLGGGSVAAIMVPHFSHAYLSDASPDLIKMWQALQDGWTPPVSVSEETYRYQRTAPVSALRGFVGYGCSFGGKWFGGYARDPRKSCSFAQTAANGLTKKMEGLRGAHFYNLDYRDLLFPFNSVIYCDPPYATATSYDRIGQFDSAGFWSLAEKWSRDSTVFVSEYVAPAGWVSVWEGTPKMTLKRGDNISTATEHLWTFKGNDN